MAGVDSWQAGPADPDARRDQVIDELRQLITEALQHPHRRRMAVNLALKKLKQYREEVLAMSDRTVEAYIAELARTG